MIQASAVRIAIDARAYFQRTGIARYTRGLVAALAERADGCEILLLISDHHRPEELSLPPHITVQVSGAPWLGGEPERLVLEREAVAWRADLFHAIFPPVSLDRVPSVVTVFDVTPLTHPHLHQEVVRASFTERWTRLRTTRARLVAVSRATRQAMIEAGAADEHPAVIGIGLSPPFDAPLDDRSLASRTGVLFVGTLEPRKNAPLVIDAVRRLRQRGVDASLSIVGKTGWGDQDWSRQLPDEGSIRLLGFVPDEELLALYRRTAILVCPSEVEGFGLPVLEAMAQGVLPIVSNTPALVELVDEPACVTETSAAAIADTLALWLSDEPARVLATRHLSAHARRFSWPSIADAWLALYAELAA
jgi:glycosyltransferase involved in cell wall biosynthesis